MTSHVQSRSLVWPLFALFAACVLLSVDRACVQPAHADVPLEQIGDPLKAIGALPASPSAPATPALEAFLVEDVIPAAGSSVLALVVGLLGVFARAMQKKWHFELTQKQLDHLDELAEKGVAFAEEQAAAYVKARGDKLPANAKLDSAVRFVREQAKAAGLPAKLTAEVGDLINAKLATISGVGATGANHVGA